MAENQEQDKKEKPKVFRGKEALALARKGKDAWNAWAEENQGRPVDFTGVDFTVEENKGISFESFTFPGRADFTEAKFQTAIFQGAIFKGEAKFYEASLAMEAYFTGVVFEEETNFIEATFEATAFFNKTIFNKAVYFGNASFNNVTTLNGATFENYVGFNGATFASPVDFQGSRFRVAPDFRSTDFKKHLTLHGMKVDFRRPAKSNDADMYRRLKELAVNARDHDREQEFFAFELIAKRGHETHGLKLIPNYLYEWTSDFGRSLRRPCAWLIGVWLAFGILYRGLTPKNMGDIWDGLSFSAAQLLPFLGASKNALSSAKVALYGNGSLSVGINALGMLEGGLGILFLFLIGLALRNRFRI